VSQDVSDREASTSGVLWLGAGAIVGGAVGWGAGDVVGGTVGALLATCVLGVGLAIARVKTTATALDGPAPDLRGLDPKQALAVLGSVARGASTHALDLESPQGQAVERARQAAQRDPAAGLSVARTIADEFPRSGLVRGELARQLFAHAHPEAPGVAGEAIALALDGGSNPLAARLLVEFFEHRDALSLPDTSLPRLAGAAEAAGHADAARWCRDRRQG
jgi:hypothetical protein